MNLRTVVPASAQPLTLAEARLQCNVTPYVADANSPPEYTHPDDDLITALITTSCQHVESFCNVIMTDAVYEFRTRCFGGLLMLPRGPVADVDWVKYLDEDEALQTLADTEYYLDDNPWAPAIGLKKDKTWPAIYVRDDAVRVQFSGGFYSPTFPMPAQLLQAMKMMIGHWYRNREAVAATQMYEVPLAAECLMMPHRRGMGV
jgi:uncharacterized phiE125 gp8 family phage protein